MSSDKTIKRPVPEFQSIDEMARFWDQHDTTDFDLGEPEEIQYVPKRLVLSVRFDVGDMIALTRKARQLGMDRSTFVRFVVKQYLKASSDQEAASRELSPSP